MVPGLIFSSRENEAWHHFLLASRGVGMAEGPRLVLAGGCGSSGTTLLANLLGRHPPSWRRPSSTSSITRDASLEALRTGLDALFARRRLSHGFKLVVSFLTPSAAVGIDRTIVEKWLFDAKSIDDVYGRFAAHMCAERRARYFVEKTPTNVYNFRAFAREHSAVPLIHQIRDGRDVAASLVKRGKTLFYAGSRWLYDTRRASQRAARLNTWRRATRRWCRMRRERSAPCSRTSGSSTTRHARDGVGLGASTYEEKWRDEALGAALAEHAEDPISPSSVGRYRQVLSRDQIATLSRIRLTARAAAELDAERALRRAAGASRVSARRLTGCADRGRSRAFAISVPSSPTTATARDAHCATRTDCRRSSRPVSAD